VSRVDPLSPRDWPEGLRESLAAAYRPADPRHPVPPPDPAAPKGLNLMGTLAHHPELTTAYNQLIRHALYFSTLTPRQRELLVLRVAHRRDAPYEWAQHAYQGAVAGLSPEEVARVRAGPDAEGWDGPERALLRAADELVDRAEIAEPTYAALAADLDTRQLMDVVFTVGVYDLLAMALRSFAVDLDDDLLPYR
jgi:alkylhydroperoxidase family enzyme